MIIQTAHECSSLSTSQYYCVPCSIFRGVVSIRILAFCTYRVALFRYHKYSWHMEIIARNKQNMNSNYNPPKKYKVPSEVINGAITPISKGGRTPVTHVFSAVYKASNSIYNDCWGPPFTNDNQKIVLTMTTFCQRSGQIIIFHLDFPEIAGVPFPFQNATFWGVNRSCELAS